MSMLDEALALRRRGWSVIPLRPAVPGDAKSGKAPLVEWVTFQERLPTEEEIRNWWHRHPDANVGVVTGRVSGLVVVDLDPKRGANVEQELRAHPTALVVRTGSGGAHLYYRYPASERHVANRVEAGGRDVRADGGQVVAPPSRHFAGGVYSWVDDGPPSPCPDWVLRGGRDDGSRLGGQQAAWLSSLLADGAGEGGRNDAAAKIAGYLAGKALPQDVALGIVQAWNARNRPPLPDREVQTTVESVYRTASRRVTEQEERSYQHVVAPSSPSLVSGKSPFTLMSFGAYMARFSDTETRWLVDDWMPESTIAFSISPPGTFKTWTLLDLCVSVASGKPFLGHFPVNNPGPVIVIQQEDYHGQTVERLGVISASRLGVGAGGSGDDFDVQLPPPLPIYVHPDRLVRFHDKRIMDALAEQIRALKPRLVVLDPLYSAGQTDDYMAKTAEQMFVFKGLRDEVGCSFLVAHHTKKSAEGTDRQGGWGSQFLNAFLETGWQIRPHDDRTVRVRRHFKSAQNAAEILVGFDISTKPNDARYATTISEAPADGQVSVEQILQVLSDFREPMSISAIADELRVHRSTVSRKVKALVDSGKVRKEGRKLAIEETPQF